MGICIFGQGDCSDKINVASNTFNMTLNENIKQTMITTSDNTGAKLAGEQVIDIGNIKGVGCRVIIGPITQKMVFKYSFSKMSERMSKSQFESQMKEDVKKTINANTDIKREFLGSAGQDVTVQESTMNNNINRIVNSFTYSDFQSLCVDMDTKQRVGLAGIEMDCTPFILAGHPELAEIRIESISQDIFLDVLVKKIAKNMTEEFVKLAQDNQRNTDVGVTAKTTATGPISEVGGAIATAATGIGTGIGTAATGVGKGVGYTFLIPILAIVGVILFIVLIAVAAKFAMGRSAAASTPAAATPTTGKGELIEVGE